MDYSVTLYMIKRNKIASEKQYRGYRTYIKTSLSIIHFQNILVPYCVSFNHCFGARNIG